MSPTETLVDHEPVGLDDPALDHAPLSLVQQQLWFAERMDPDQSLYTEALAVRVSGELDTVAVERALREILRRHESLRTVFPLVGDDPVQEILPPGTRLDLERTSLGDIAAADREDAALRAVTAFVEQPLDLTTDLLTRATLIEMGERDHVLVVLLHHLVCDGLSGRIVFSELGELYREFAAGNAPDWAEPELQYVDFTEWEHDLHESGHLDGDVDYWRGQLAGVTSTLELPARRPRPEKKSVAGRRDMFPLAEGDAGAAVATFCRSHSVSVYTLTLAAFSATVGRYTAQDDLVFGTLVANRPRSELENVVGNFTNTVPMRIDLSGDPTLHDLLARAARTAEEAIDHGMLSLGKIIELSRPSRDPSRNALIQHLFLTSGQPASEAHWGSATVVPFDVPRHRGRLDTIIEIEERGEDLVTWVEYDTELLDHDEVEQLMRHFAVVLEQWLAAPDLPVSGLRLLDDAEVATHVGAGGAPADPRPAPPSGTPGTSVALAAGGRSWTFDDLAAAGSAPAEHEAVRVRPDGPDHGDACARVLAAAGRDLDVVLCTCAADGCACPPLAARQVVRIADALTDVLDGPLVLAGDLAPEDRLLAQLAGVLTGHGSTLRDAGGLAAAGSGTVVVTGPEGAPALADAAPPRTLVIVGRADDALVDRLEAAGHTVTELAGHPGVLGPVVRIGRNGDHRSVAALRHVDAVVLDAFAHVAPVGVHGRLYLGRAPFQDRNRAGAPDGGAITGITDEPLVRTDLTVRRTAAGTIELLADPSAPEPAGTDAGTGDGGPLDALLAELWQDALDVDDIGPDDDFFELGGHSMVAARMIEQLRETVQVDVPLRTLFSYSRLGEFAGELRASFPEIEELLAALGNLSDEDTALLLGEASSEDDAAEVAPKRPTRFPLTSSQLQIWLMEYLRGAGITYTIPLRFAVSGPLDVPCLLSALQAVVDRHDMLRVTVEVTDDGDPVQVVHDDVVLDVPVTDLTGRADAADAEAAISRDMAYTEFSTTEGPLLAAHVVRTAPEEHALYIVFHHLVMDERSMTVFMRELSATYRAAADGTPAPDAPAVQISDYVAWEQDQLSGARLDRLRAFWRSRLAGVPELELPTDRPRPENLTFDGEFLYRTQERELFDGLAALSADHQVTPYIAFTAATAVLLHRLSGQDSFMIGMPSDNRVMRGSDELIGCFLNVLPVRVDATGAPTFATFLSRLRDEIAGVYDHRALPLTSIVDAVGAERVANRLPLFQVTTELQLDGWMPLELPGCTVDYAFVGHGTARYDTAFHAIAKADSFEVAAEVNSGVSTFETGYRRLDQLAALLRQVVADPQRPIADYDIDKH